MIESAEVHVSETLAKVNKAGLGRRILRSEDNVLSGLGDFWTPDGLRVQFDIVVGIGTLQGCWIESVSGCLRKIQTSGII
jgi:hypothetical protein